VLAAFLAGCGGGGGGGGPGAPAPVAEFRADPGRGRAPLTVRFHDLSSADVTAWSWDFGDGAVSAEREPEHVYDTVGTYPVRLSVRSPAGEHVRERPAVEVTPEPVNAIEFGMNPSFQRWSSREIVFADAMMRASEFVIVRDGETTLEPAPLIPLGRAPARLGQGWPDLDALPSGESAAAWLFGSMEGTLPDGRSQPYVLTWEGTGDCMLIGTAVLGELRRRPRRVEVLIDPTLGGGNGTVALWIENS